MIHRQDRDSVAVLRLEHGKANAVDSELFDQLGERLDELRRSPASALVLTGTGGIFSAGVNLFKVVEGGGSYLAEFLPKLSQGIARLLALPQPVVAAINGHAIAGGCVLACACDRRMMADGNARIGLTELLVGVPFPAAALETVRALLPAHRVQDLVYRGRTLAPGEALAAGLVDELAKLEGLLERACAVARELGEIPGEAFALTKRHLRRPLLERIERYGPEVDPEVLRQWSQPETREAIRAFMERTVHSGAPGRQ